MESIEIIIIGAGVVGLACARELSQTGKELLIIENNENIGQETSSRNSEVLHAGIYYQKDSLKAKFCADGKKLLYQYCETHQINYQKIGKLILASNNDEIDKLNKIHQQAIDCGVDDLRVLNKRQIHELEPQVQAFQGLYSPSTGIIDSHGLMLSLLGQAQDHGAMLAVNSKFINAKAQNNYTSVTIATGQENMTLQAKHFINCTGLNASIIANNISDLNTTVPSTYYYKGNYFSINGKSPFNHLIYPIPESGGLGIHSTNDLNGSVRFGPDVEYTDKIDYKVNLQQAQTFQKSIAQYWPEINNHTLKPEFVGIRPKCRKIEHGANDFNIQHLPRGDGSITNLYGIESPGLTASLAIAKHIKSLIIKD